MNVVNFDAIKREKKRKQIEAMYVKFYGNQYALAGEVIRPSAGEFEDSRLVKLSL